MTSYTGVITYRCFSETIHHTFRAEATRDPDSPSHLTIEVFWDGKGKGAKAFVHTGEFPIFNERGVVLETLKEKGVLPEFPYMVRDFKIVWFT